MVPVYRGSKGPLIITVLRFGTVTSYPSATHQNRIILSEPPVIKNWRLGKTSKVLTKSSWASGVEDINSLVYSNHYVGLALCLCPKTWHTTVSQSLIDWWRCYANVYQKRNTRYTLSQEPLSRISWSPDPTRLSQKARLVTGPVWPFKVKRGFPVL